MQKLELYRTHEDDGVTVKTSPEDGVAPLFLVECMYALYVTMCINTPEKFQGQMNTRIAEVLIQAEQEADRIKEEQRTDDR